MDLTDNTVKRRPATGAIGDPADKRAKPPASVSDNQETPPTFWATGGNQAGARTLRQRRAGPFGLLGRLRYRRRRRSRQVPELPGLWHSPRFFYRMARESVVQHDDGWAVQTADPGHRFVSWELAVRYEAAAKAARLHYTQICDLAEDDECQERLHRISGHLDEMRMLSEAEQTVRPMLGDDPRFLKSLSWCPRPLYAEPPPEPRLAGLASAHLGDLLPALNRVIDLQGSGGPFQPEPLRLLLEADRAIPGAGAHHSVFVDGNNYVYPFDAGFEAVIRPLRYSLAQIGGAYAHSTSARFAVQTAAGHLEGCLKALCGRWHMRKPLGALLHTREAKSLLDSDIRDAMAGFAEQAANPAKHDYANADGPIPLFSFADAVYSHFLARRLGAAALGACGQLNAVVAAVEEAAERNSYFRGAHLPIPPPDTTAADQPR